MVDEGSKIPDIYPGDTVAVSFVRAAQWGKGQEQMVYKEGQISNIHTLKGVCVNVSRCAKAAAGVTDSVIVRVQLIKIGN